jgi:hypothetical protein
MPPHQTQFTRPNLPDLRPSSVQQYISQTAPPPQLQVSEKRPHQHVLGKALYALTLSPSLTPIGRWDTP